MAKRLHIIAASLLMALSPLVSQVAMATIVGTIGPASGACNPFSCFSAAKGLTFQQRYAASAFPSPQAIDTITFFTQDPGEVDIMDFAVDFYLLPSGFGSLAPIPAANRANLLSNFGLFQLSGFVFGPLSLSGSSFNYDPALGDLMMEITVLAHNADAHGPVTFAEDISGGAMDRLLTYLPTGTGPVESGGFVTSFDSVSGPVPEPATWAMMLAGFGLIGAGLRRRTVWVAKA